MKLGIMQPYFYPYIGYWQLLNLVDEYVIYDDVNYIKRGWVNRNRILIQGQARWIHLKIRNASQNRLIMDTEVAQTPEDTRNLLTTIELSYRKAPYFEPVYALLERSLSCDRTNLAEYLLFQIKAVCEYLGITTKLLLSSDIPKDQSARGEQKILEICRCRGADCYVNAIGGRELYHQQVFREHGLQLAFLHTGEVSYRQTDHGFVPDLSMIDVMMFNSRGQVRELLTQFTLEE